MALTIYHNPRCSKSRQTLALLNERGLEPQIKLYLEDPPSAAELDRVLTLLGKTPLEVMRTGESLFKELGLSKGDSKSRRQWIQIMVDHPKLIERPIVVADGQARLGRPPEAVLEII